MPWIHLETTSDLPENAAAPDILAALTDELARIEAVDPKAIKSYHSLRSVWVMGPGGPPGFAHCAVRILEGRPPEVLEQISTRLYAVLEEWFAASLGADEVSVTFELREMSRSTYRKS